MSTSSGRFRLVVQKGPNPGAAYDLTQIVAIIGRDASADLAINDVEVSRQHARLSATETGFTIEDLASTNGVFVNGVRITAPTELSGGDVVGIGQTVELGVEAVPAEGVATLYSAQPAAAALPSLPTAEAPAPAPAPEVRPSSGGFGLPSAGPSQSLPSSTPVAAPSSSGGNRSWMPWAIGGGCAFIVLCLCLPAVAWTVMSGMLGN
ncbi:MAG TPA: FHA domain-containing protein [Anaerolineales bacterium]|nr:FHA domain-containing protein [Anaerolineales bacterium]